MNREGLIMNYLLLFGHTDKYHEHGAFFCLSLYYKAKTIFWRTNKSHIVYKIKVKNLRSAYRYFISIGFYQSATISNALQHNFIYKKGSTSSTGYQYFGFTQYHDEGSFTYKLWREAKLAGRILFSCNLSLSNLRKRISLKSCWSQISRFIKV